ncbi:uncharacterized protein LOC120559387 isoform X1 [Tachysurus ichikawai]
MCIKFSDDLGMDEEAVDLVGPRREFVWLLMEALLKKRSVFPCWSSYRCKPCSWWPSTRILFLPTLYSCLVGGKSSVKPVLEDVADADLYEKVKKENQSR